MLAKLLLVFLVSYASASHYAWKPNTEYTYRVAGRTLSGLPDHDPTMTGILLKSELKIVPKTPEVLTARLQQSQYSRVQMKFRDSWEEPVPESECQYKPLAISEEPFEIHLQDGIIKDVVVSKSLKNWEANMIKSFVSQLQLNVNAKHPIDSEITILPHKKNPVGAYKVMEKTVTGEFETIYTMKPEPDNVWPVLAHESQEDSNENILISKSKNFTNHGAFVGYHFGFGEMETSEPNTDSMGNFMNRTSVSHAVIYGDLEDYVIKASNTSNVVSFSPLFNNGESGIIASRVSLVLKNMQPGKCFNSLSEPVEAGLLYRYDNSHGNNQVESAHKPYHVADEESTYNRPGYQRLNQLRSRKSHGQYHLDQSKQELDQPSSAMSFYSSGYHGKFIKYSDKVNIAEEAKKLAQDFGQDLQHPNELPKTQLGSRGVKYSTGQSGGHRFDSRRGTVYGIQIVFMW
nr:vitellogenin-like [Onthophagus taurus]